MTRYEESFHGSPLLERGSMGGLYSLGGEGEK